MKVEVAEKEIICCLLDDWTMLFQLVGAVSSKTGLDERNACAKTFDVLHKLLKEGHIEIGYPIGDGKGGFNSWTGSDSELEQQLMILRSSAGFSLQKTGDIWVQLNEKGFNYWRSFLDEC